MCAFAHFMSATAQVIEHDVHFEPRFCSDFVLHYTGTDFHVHKFVLAKESKYFFELLEKQEAIIQLELPPLTDINKKEISAQDFGQWLTLLYGPMPTEYEKYFASDFSDTKTAQIPFYAIVALSHYFDSTRVEKELQMICITVGKIVMNRKLLNFLKLPLYYHWKDAVESIQNEIAKRLVSIRKNEAYKHSEWTDLSQNTREAILEKFVLLH
jgi:hypothetical protein